MTRIESLIVDRVLQPIVDFTQTEPHRIARNLVFFDVMVICIISSIFGWKWQAAAMLLLIKPLDMLLSSSSLVYKFFCSIWLTQVVRVLTGLNVILRFAAGDIVGVFRGLLSFAFLCFGLCSPPAPPRRKVRAVLAPKGVS